MKTALKNTGLYLFLTPVFFVLHGYVENFGLLSIKDCLFLLLTYEGIAALLLLFVLLINKKHLKAAFIAFCITCFYLFFGAIRDWLMGLNLPLYEYRFIIPAFFVFLLALIIYLKKTGKTLLKLTSFLNLLLLILIIADSSAALWKSFWSNRAKATLPQTSNFNYLNCDTCKKPDIYFLIFDEYASSLSLKTRFGYDNSNFDLFLKQKGFYVIGNSHSNYDITPFSMASILNMSYLQGLSHPTALTIKDYANSNQLIQNNQVISYLSHQGYDIVNYSIFDLNGHHSVLEQTFLPLKTKPITDQTLLGCIEKENGWVIYGLKFKLRKLIEKIESNGASENERTIELAKKESRVHSIRPKFIYVHLFLPHSPFYFDKNLHKRNPEEVAQLNENTICQEYLDYLPYTNQKAEDLINTIQQNTNNSAVIIFMGDHGFRYYHAGDNTFSLFENQNAIYFPDRDHSSLNDSISGVNEFRFILNKLFKTGLPLLKDSIIILANKRK